MNPVNIVNSLGSSHLGSIDPQISSSEIRGAGVLSTQAGSVPTDSFSSMLDGLVGAVDAKQSAAVAQTNQVLMGESGQLHQSVIAMQEASVAFSLMVQVRNKLVESYQELMRMQV